ncbi:histidine--tRNA ligase, chloroplastic/mitochondrial [Ricinus communis]|uniref:histidine--tRNA ligase n=1 Tax=Ricinus communis TaxID=3988 RepID=B9S0H3_RICCO|nr:histidine--tRNA ligase, chloroplastic/mitochondrial [Ricinus communis]EEF42906.1 histidyl-tRNA synthetase, putative [Ricinus communis]|eukprot:XP_002519492.1 histidine--tRNA ligase, chloroplastic/mitochondrial [Ricinus communis]
MPPITSSLHIRFSLHIKPIFLSFTRFSHSSLSPRKLPLSIYPRTLSSIASSYSPIDNVTCGAGGGRSGGLTSPPPVLEEPIEKIDVNPPKGTRDFPPEEMRLRNWLFNNFREVSKLYGFEEVDFPVLETEALFIRKAGEEIRDQLYCFEDRGNRRVALRPELTPSLARLVIQKGKSVPLPLKWFAVGQCWRYERMTRGRRREHYQWNMDIIGVPGVTAEAELISSIVTFFKRIGITASDVGFKVSSRKVLQEVLRCYSISDNLFGKVCIIIDKIEKIPVAEIKKELKSVGMSEEAVEELLQVLSIKSLTKLEEILGGAGEAIGDLKQLFSLAEKFGYSEWIQFDASVVRGLAYYTGIVFEGFDREGKLRAICGGGRYDRLLSTFGGDDLPACGFGFGDAVIVELLKEKGLLPELGLQVENIVCALDSDLQGAAARVATILREKGQNVDLVLEDKPLKWVFKRAARINAQKLVLVGKTEWQKGMVGVKILSTGEQYEVKLDELQ